jgi:pimeloyl-ACP methyl ester carboxylesterase
VPLPATVGTHLLVVIDHREARIYQAELHGSVPQRIVPYDPFGFGRDLHYNQDDSDGQRKPERRSFYEAVAKTLHGAQQILLFGAGTGASSAMEQLLLNLKQHHPDLAQRVVGAIVVDEHHLTEDQLLAKARELFVVA